MFVPPDIDGHLPGGLFTMTLMTWLAKNGFASGRVRIFTGAFGDYNGYFIFTNEPVQVTDTAQTLFQYNGINAFWYNWYGNYPIYPQSYIDDIINNLNGSPSSPGMYHAHVYTFTFAKISVEHRVSIDDIWRYIIDEVKDGRHEYFGKNPVFDGGYVTIEHNSVSDNTYGHNTPWGSNTPI